MFLKIKKSDVFDMYIRQLSYFQFYTITEQAKSAPVHHSGAILYESCYSDPAGTVRIFSSPQDAIEKLSVGDVQKIMNEILIFNGIENE